MMMLTPDETAGCRAGYNATTGRHEVKSCAVDQHIKTALVDGVEDVLRAEAAQHRAAEQARAAAVAASTVAEQAAAAAATAPLGPAVLAAAQAAGGDGVGGGAANDAAEPPSAVGAQCDGGSGGAADGLWSALDVQGECGGPSLSMLLQRVGQVGRQVTILLTRCARIALGTATQCTRKNDSPGRWGGRWGGSRSTRWRRCRRTAWVQCTLQGQRRRRAARERTRHSCCGGR
jgi:hypothetical protein